MKGTFFKYNIEKYFFRQTEMEYLGFWVTCKSTETVNKNVSNNKYEATHFPKGSSTVYRCSELLPRYVWKSFIYVIAFKEYNVQ